MAIAERHLAARLNTSDFAVMDHKTVVFASDGDMMEGVQSEAASLAGQLGLGHLIVLYDANRITIDGPTDLAFDVETVGRRYEAYGWRVEPVDGHDRAALARAFENAWDDAAVPRLIVARTHIAYGAPTKQDTAAAHGAPLGADEVRQVKEAMGWSLEPFHLPEEVRAAWLSLGRAHRDTRLAWERGFAEYGKRHPERGALWESLNDPRPRVPAEGRPSFAAGSKASTRKASLKALEWLKPRVPALLGGSADLTPSNLTQIGEDAPFSRENPAGRYFHFGVREHAMAAAMNGMALHGGLRPYGGTFLIFSDYMRPALRLSCLMQARAIYVFTHDSIFLGEDGPTHQPIAALPALRALPHLTVIRPSDPEETVEAWETALVRPGPVALILTRQDVPVLDRAALGTKDGLERGAYVLWEPAGGAVEAIAFATGSEVAPTLEAARTLHGEGRRVRVVAVPSWELFLEQDAAYRRKVLAPEVSRRMAVEAASPLGWERFVGTDGTIVGMRGFGASAPWNVLAEQFGFTAGALAETMRRLLAG
jgi:transketolase